MIGCGGARSELGRGIHGDSVQKAEWWCYIGRERAKDIVGHRVHRGLGYGWANMRS